MNIVIQAFFSRKLPPEKFPEPSWGALLKASWDLRKGFQPPPQTLVAIAKNPQTHANCAREAPWRPPKSKDVLACDSAHQQDQWQRCKWICDAHVIGSGKETSGWDGEHDLNARTDPLNYIEHARSLRKSMGVNR